MAGIAWFAAALTVRERARFAAGFTFLWVFGAWFYFATPSLGPCYVLKDDYIDVRAAMPRQSATMDLLFAHYGRIRSLHRHPEGADISPYLGVAAMPSLHVGAQAFFMFFARRRSKALFVVFAALTALTLFTSVVSGWHYAIDGYAGAPPRLDLRGRGKAQRAARVTSGRCGSSSSRARAASARRRSRRPPG